MRGSAMAQAFSQIPAALLLSVFIASVGLGVTIGALIFWTSGKLTRKGAA